VGQRTFETRSLYLILAEKLFTLPAANEMLPLSALFAGRYRDVGFYLPIDSSSGTSSRSRTYPLLKGKRSRPLFDRLFYYLAAAALPAAT
jgi:hypothetical protein